MAQLIPYDVKVTKPKGNFFAMPFPWQRPNKDFASGGMFSPFLKHGNFDILKIIQHIYLQKSNYLCYLKKSKHILPFNITNGKAKKKFAECVSMATNRDQV